MSHESDLRKIRKNAEAQGWRVEKKQHWWLFHWPGIQPGEVPCQIGGTGHTQGRALANLRSCLRRRGYRE